MVRKSNGLQHCPDTVRCIHDAVHPACHDDERMLTPLHNFVYYTYYYVCPLYRNGVFLADHWHAPTCPVYVVCDVMTSTVFNTMSVGNLKEIIDEKSVTCCMAMSMRTRYI